MKTTTCPRKGTSPPQRKKSIPHQPRKTRWAGGFLHGGSSEDDNDDDDDDDDEEETEDSSGYSGDSGGDDGSDDNSDASAAPPIKRHKVVGTHWW
jgi:hypothetical protein